LHYLENFLLFEAPEGLGRNGEPQQSQQYAREQVLAVCAKLSVPVADAKTVGPTTVLTFWGIELNTAELHVFNMLVTAYILRGKGRPHFSEVYDRALSSA